MLNQADFGRRLRFFRRLSKLSQKETALKMGVSEQAVSKWENGECLPDVYHLKLLGKILNISVDTLLDTERDRPEKVIEIIKIGGAEFEIIEKPETILGGKIIYAEKHKDIDGFHHAIEATTEEEKQAAYGLLRESAVPVTDIQLSVNFWREWKSRAYGFVREVWTQNQPEGIEVYKLPPSLYIKAYTDRETARLLAKEECEPWELFAYIRNFFMPSHGFAMADNGAQELEVFDSFEHRTGYAYMPVRKNS